MSDEQEHGQMSRDTVRLPGTGGAGAGDAVRVR